MSIRNIIDTMKEKMELEGIKPENGLGTELFLFSSTLAPVVNVDLLVTNKKHQILLSCRDDVHCGFGWHIPGGCVRFKETLVERLQKTALDELGSEVIFIDESIKVFEIFSESYRENLTDQRERAHSISLVYGCILPANFDINDNQRCPGTAGYLKWFDDLPNDLVAVQDCYRKNWQELRNKLRECFGGIDYV